jgi:ring-1,2-phenylacetyl-CoA epoxidase subunit PaaE
MPKFHSLTVSDVRRETEDTVSVAFDIPAELVDEYTFKQGQYLTFKIELGGEEIRRNYSICTSPLEGELRVAIKKVEGGLFSTYANEKLAAGDILEVMTPLGRFYTNVEPGQKKSYLACAAGSGITPVMSHMKTVLSVEPNSTFTLIYGNKNTASIIFREEIEDLKNTYMGRLRVFHVLSREASEFPFLQGHINADKCQTFFKHFIEIESLDEVFLCGPAPMIDAVRGSLQEAGFERKQIHFELFASPQQLAERKEEKTVAKKSDGFQANVKIIIDGLATEFEMNSEDTNILDAAMKNGADLPFACKGGVCATCRAKVDEGNVKMDINYSLEPDEVSRGFVLTCQSHPTTESVVINFDEV